MVRPLPPPLGLALIYLVCPQVQVPPPPGSQITPIGIPQPYMLVPVPQPGMPMVPLPPMPQGMPPPPLPDEPEPKRQKLDDSMLIPEDQFLAQHTTALVCRAPVHINACVPNVDEGNIKGQVLEITVQSLSETVGSLNEKIAGEIQLPANKQKLSGKAGFLKHNLSLAYYNVGAGETLLLSLRERGERNR
ncbi:hypothetical protein Ancab_002411 [Ancistrocladus abbreviatus]